MGKLAVIDWCIFAGYLAFVFALGLWFARRQRDTEEYFVGSRKMNWFAVGVSLFATAFSSIAFVSLPREGAYADYHLLVTYLCIPLIITPLLWWVFVPVYHRLGFTSVYEYLEIRFSRHMRRLGTLLFALYVVGWMGAMVYATGLIVEAALDLGPHQLTWILIAIGLFATVYTAVGGIRAVVWTDVLQAATLGGGMLAVLLLTIRQIDGGWSSVIEVGMEHGKFQMFEMDLNPCRSDLTFFSAVSLALFAYLPGYAVAQTTVQRYLCIDRLANARRALLINAVVATVVAVLFFFVGTTLFVYYQQADTAALPNLADKEKDQIMPLFVLSELRYKGLSGLLIAGLFAAVMSTIDSGINALTAVVVYDWLGGRRTQVWFSRLLCCVFGVAVIGAALLVPCLGDSVIKIIMKIAGAFLGLLFGVYLMGLLVRRANTPGALIGLAAGSLSLTLVWTLTNVAGWWYGPVTCLPVFVIGSLASFLFPPPRPEQLRGLVFAKD